MKKITLYTIICACILLLFAIIIGVSTISDDTQKDKPTESDRQTENELIDNETKKDETLVDTEQTEISTEESTEVNSNDSELIYGLPMDIFQNTQGRSYKFAIKNLITGEEYLINENTHFDSITYKFSQSDPMGGATPMPEPLIQPGKTMVETRFGTDIQNDVFVFGTINDSQEDQYFESNRLIYVSYRGSDEWSICGVNTAMSKEQVIELWGTPTQEYQTDMG